MPSDHELLLKRSRELILTAKITVSESGEAIRRAQQLLTAMKLSKVRATPSDAYSRAPSPIAPAPGLIMPAGEPCPALWGLE